MVFFQEKKRSNYTDPASFLSKQEKVFTPVEDLLIGMYVTELDRPWEEAPFLFQGFELETEEQVRKVRDLCEYVYIDMTKQVIPKPAGQHRDSERKHVFSRKPPSARLGSFEQEFDKADVIFSNTGSLVKQVMDRVAAGGGIDVKLAKQAVAECVNSVLHSPDAFLWLTQLKNRDEYTAQHSMNVCILSIVIGRHVNLTVRELNEVGLCGMMHDMGKMLVPLEILNKPGKLDIDELEVMRSHTTLGYELLKSSANMFAGAIDVAYSHHEKLDGTGYLRRLPRRNLTTYTRMVAIADFYDAITSDRVYQKGRTHLEAIKIISDLSGPHLDPDLVVKFIESIGIYPPGCLVKMNDGSIAIVVEINPRQRLRPKIIVILDRGKNKVPEKVVDLAGLPTDENGQILTITGIVRAEDHGIDLRKYYHDGIVEKGFAAIS